LVDCLEEDCQYFDLVIIIIILCCVWLAGGSTNWKTFADVKAQNLGHEKAEYFNAKGTVVFMKKENCMYTVSGYWYCLHEVDGRETNTRPLM